MKSYVETYNASKFHEAYGIYFPDVGIAATSNEKHWRAFFEFSSWDPGDHDVKKAFTLELFGYILYPPSHIRFIIAISHRPDATKDVEIKHGLQADVYNFIVTAFEDYSGTDYTKDDNEWYNETKQDNFPYTQGPYELDFGCAYFMGIRKWKDDRGWARWRDCQTFLSVSTSCELRFSILDYMVLIVISVHHNRRRG